LLFGALLCGVVTLDAHQTESSAAAPNAAADPRAVVVAGQARFTVLTPQLIRLEWDEDGRFEDRASLLFINRHLPVPPFTKRMQRGWLTIRTEKLTLRYKLNSGAFHPQNLTVEFVLNGKTVRWAPGVFDDGNLGGTRRTLDGANGAVPLDPGLLSRNGWYLEDDSDSPVFDAPVDSPNWAWATSRSELPQPSPLEKSATGNGSAERPSAPRQASNSAPGAPMLRQDWYFFAYGHDYRGELRDFVRVAGRIPLPPRFVFGAWWSRYWAYTDEEFEKLIDDFHAHDVPLDVLVVDMDWHPTFSVRWWENKMDPSGHVLGWTGYSWNPLYFPEPAEFLKWVHHQDLKVTLNMHPASGVQPFEEAYPAMARAMGIDPATKQYVPFDIANKKFATNYINILHHSLENEGVDFFWLDWQQEATTSVPGLNPTWWLNYVHFTDMERQGKRPLLFHRWGGLGNHRYEIGFSGDVYSTWPSLAFQPYFTATAANVGYGYWSHDIGGHLPGTVEPELFTRWVQWGAFSPVLRTHATKNPDAERRIWAYPPQYASAMRSAFLLRYALVPYIYTAAREAYDTGVSLLHPLYYDFPESDEAYAREGGYFFGPSMIAAPVVAPADAATHLATRSLWLPEGPWIEWPTGARFTGPVQLTRQFALDEIPIYVRPGTIVPMAPKMSSTSAQPLDPLILQIFAGPSGEGKLYEDAGDTLGYQTGAFAWTHFAEEQLTDGSLEVKISPSQGGFPGMPARRGYQLRIYGVWPPESIQANGQTISMVPPADPSNPELALASPANQNAAAGWRYDGETATLIVDLAKTAVNTEVDVRISFPDHGADSAALLENLPGRIARLRGAMQILDLTWPRGWAPDILLDAAQCGHRVTLKPETAFSEYQKLVREWPDIVKAVDRMDVDRVQINAAVAHLSEISH
jgi:alpha-glucosidase (family GH31 glycosyl hydrolase)